MKTVYAILTFLLFVLFNCKAQNIEVITDTKANLPKIKKAEFHFINNEIDTTKITYIGRYKNKVINIKESNIRLLFFQLAREANKNGANAFKLIDYSVKQNDPVSNYLTLDLYFADDKELEKNYTHFPYNMMYVFGNLNNNADKPRKMKFNDEVVLLNPFQYYAYQNKIGQTSTVGVGGFTGGKVWVTGREKNLPDFFSLSGIGVGSAPAGTAGASLNTGRVYPVDFSLGNVLIRILKKQN